MARRNPLAKLFLFVVLELGVLAGVPVKPDEIERLTARMNQALVTEVRRDTDDGDPPNCDGDGDGDGPPG